MPFGPGLSGAPSSTAGFMGVPGLGGGGSSGLPPASVYSSAGGVGLGGLGLPGGSYCPTVQNHIFPRLRVSDVGLAK